MKYIIQLPTGSWSTLDYSSQDILHKLQMVIEMIPVDKVILGWYPDPHMYQSIGAFLDSYGIDMVLWMPVFSEIGDFVPVDPAKDLWGNAINPKLAQHGETFNFCCPSSDANIQAVLDIYRNHFSQCGFKGVFLDRIRTHSFGGGVAGVLSCGCNNCRRKFLDRGLSPDTVIQAYECLGDHFFDTTDYSPDLGYNFANKAASDFFRAKGDIVSGSISKLCHGFKDMGLTVGLDLFAPLMSDFVGQNYAQLASHADFIKPMLYRRTLAPAGIGYEYDLLRQNAPSATGYPQMHMGQNFLLAQVESLKNLPCAKFPGVEINHNQQLVPTDPEYIRSSIRTIIQGGADGVTLSWNIMEAPREHILALQ